MTTDPTATRQPSKKTLYDALSSVSIADERRFVRRLRKARSPEALNAIDADIARASAKMNAIDEAVPPIEFPDSLPVSHRVDDISEAIDNHQVVIIAGETGSGKTTQIPKICLELGRGRRGRIGHTQPRRLAARTVAERISEELDQPLGTTVGYAIRFDDQVSSTTAVKLMTDGILLAELQRDRFLNAYDTIIIDEAHERSLNIDFLLGYLKRLLPRRPDLKVIITSATINPHSFAQHFSDPDTGEPAPIVEVSGRTFPVEIRYRPLEIEREGTLIEQEPLDGLCDAIDELMAEGDGDILCFFPGERDIRDAMEAIAQRKWRGVEVAPLFGRLSNKEQHRIFQPHSGRRIVLATNIAETSLTVPGIRYVIDTGTARISRYSTRTKVQRLPIEPISQASANQRSGRCGRVADGIAIRLYSESDFESRPEFTDPEILRTNLASVILQMISLKLGDVGDFPFLQPPETKAVRDGMLLLHELDALDESSGTDSQATLTKIGRDLSRIPVDPRLARMLVEGHRLGCVEAVIILVAAMTVQDVRERPLDHQEKADQSHARFQDKSSDFAGLLHLWSYIRSTRKELSGNQFRKRMKSEFLHVMRIREWQDLVRQLREITRDLGWNKENGHFSSASEQQDSSTLKAGDEVHRALLSGLLSNIGARRSDSKEYSGARGTKFMIFPGSALAKKPPEFVMVSELVETSRLFARGVAEIKPEWVEKAASSLLKHQYSDPSWSYKRGAAIATQRSTLYGVPIITDRKVPYHRVDPVVAREMFIRHALVEGEWKDPFEFFHENLSKLSEAGEFEDKVRRRGIVADDEALFEFYDARIPASVTTARHFDGWWKKTRRKQPHLLDFDPDALVSAEADNITEQDFPDTWRHGDVALELSYLFEPGHRRDGVTVHIPMPVLLGLDPGPFEWLVPGLREELVTELIRSLPKIVRRSLVPAPDFAARAVPKLIAYDGSITAQLAEVFREMGVRGINASDFSPSNLPDHLRMSFAAVDQHGTIIDDDKDLNALQQRQENTIAATINKRTRETTTRQADKNKNDHSTGEADSSRSETAAHGSLQQATTWTAETIGDIPDSAEHTVDGHQVTVYPALKVTSTTIQVQAFPTRAAAEAAMMTATLTLLLRKIRVNTQQMVKGLPLQQRVAVDNYPHGGAEGLVEDARIAAIRDLLVEAGGPVRSPDKFDELTKNISPQVPAKVRAATVSIAKALVEYSSLSSELQKWEGPAIDDMLRQLEFMLPPHAITIHGMVHLQHLPRYLQAMRMRLEDMNTHPDKDAERQAIIEDCLAYLRNRLRNLPAGADKSAGVKKVRWMIQELRVSLFAQKLGTAHAVSPQRVKKAVDKLR